MKKRGRGSLGRARDEGKEGWKALRSARDEGERHNIPRNHTLGGSAAAGKVWGELGVEGEGRECLVDARG